MNKEEEIQLVHNLLLHPAGFDIDIDGVLWVRRYEHPKWAVEWSPPSDTSKVEVQEFDNALDAAIFFVNMRHERQMGLDFEIAEKK